MCANTRKRPAWKRRRRHLLLLLAAFVILAIGIPQLYIHRNQNAIEAKLIQLEAKNTPPPRPAVEKPSDPAPSTGEFTLELTSETLQHLGFFDNVNCREALRDDLLLRAKDILLAENGVFEQLHRSIRLPNGDIDFNALRHRGEIIPDSIIDLLRAEALIAGQENHPEKAYESILLALFASEFCPGTLADFQKLLKSGLFSGRQLEELQNNITFPKPDNEAEFEKRLTDGLALIDNSNAYIERKGRLIFDDYLPGTTKFLLNAGKLVGYATQQKLKFLNQMETIKACYAMPRPQGIAQLRPLARSVFSAAIPSTSGRMLEDSLVTFAKEVLQEAQANALPAALAIERYRLDNGRYPTQWAELIPAYLAAPPEDPCQGAPLGYSYSSNGYLIYSFGLDQDDDHGQHEEYMNLHWRNGDYVIVDTINPF